MRKIQEILRLKYESKLSHEKIAGALGLSKGTVAKYITQARDQGISLAFAPGTGPGKPGGAAGAAIGTQTCNR